ncbi:MAG: TRAP transporter TatT component family protein [Burkholderiales bacterium]
MASVFRNLVTHPGAIRSPGITALLLLLAAVLVSGCSIRTYAINNVGDALAASGSSFGADDDPQLIAAAAPFSLKLMESILAETPRHAGLLAAASSGFAQYAYAFVQLDADEVEARDVAAARALRNRARGLYYRARDYGMRALEVGHPGFRAQLEKDARPALARLSRDDASRLYWTTIAWVAAISLSKDSPKAVADLRLVDLMVERLRELDPDMDHGALHTFLISYEMGRPGARNPEIPARHHFEQAVRLSAGQKAGPFVAFAEGVSMPAQNRREFTEMLQRAAAIDPSARLEWRLENTIMQNRARWLLTQTDQLFLD